ncbi:MAG TPA: hypothetical protein VFU02_21665 [Polyangiaceae bacterium]|nr:hypothetical protein [Polyangiaceae bacterium]
MKYLAYGLIVESEEPLEELVGVEVRETNAPAQISFERVAGTPPPLELQDIPPPMPELHWPVIARQAGGYRLNFGEESEFWLSGDGQKIRCFRSTPATATVRHYLLDHVLPRALDLWGLNPLHSTAVATSRGVLAFLGASGTGKSTIAAALVARGCELVSDDCLVLSRSASSILAAPSYPGLRLHQDVCDVLGFDRGLRPMADYSPKQRATGGVPLAKKDLPLLVVYALSRTDVSGVSLAEFAPLGPADATMMLAGSAFRIDVERRDLHRRQLGFFAEVVRRVPVRACAFRGDLSNVNLVADAILRDASERLPQKPR